MADLQQTQTPPAPAPVVIQQAAPAAPAIDYNAPPVQLTPQGTTPAYGDPNQPKPNSFNNFFDGINWIELGLLFLGSWALFQTVYYYRYKLKEDKTSYYDVQRQIDQLGQRTSANEADLQTIGSMMQAA